MPTHFPAFEAMALLAAGASSHGLAQSTDPSTDMRRRRQQEKLERADEAMAAAEAKREMRAAKRLAARKPVEVR